MFPREEFYIAEIKIGLFLSGPKLDSSAIVNSLLICLLPVRIFNHVLLNIHLHYLFHHLVSLALKSIIGRKPIKI